MPKQPKKSKEEKLAESFFPLEKNDIRFTTEKSVKEPGFREDYLKNTTEKIVKIPISKEELLKGTVEKRYRIPEKESFIKVEKEGKKIPPKKTKKTSSKKRKKVSKKRTKINKVVKYEPPKVTLKKSGYELILTEKPQAATKIATALGDAVQRTNNRVSYYEVDRQGKKIVVACAVGHLFTLKQKVSGYEVPIFEVGWLPNYLAKKKDFTKAYYDTILKLVKGASSLIVATDFDIEGEVIGWNVVRFICNQENAKRMKFSTLTKEELNKAYENPSPEIIWGQAYAGETRHYLDWFYGINLSRALMNAIKTTGKFKIMSIGRVQGPALNLIVKKEKEIQKFTPEPYWQVFITIDDGKNNLELQYTKDIFEKQKLKEFENLIGENCKIETKKKPQEIPPQPPFNLTTLQTEAYKFHGISPSNTLRVAQSLYLAGLISYPRTSSQKLPSSVGYKEILQKLAKKYSFEHLIKRKTPIEGKKSDPAHPSIYPTGNSQILAGDDEKIYNLIVKRFLSLFCENALIESKTINAIPENYPGLKFKTSGREIKKKAWLEIYPSKSKEIFIPDMKEQGKITNKREEEKETQPPRRYSPASMLTELEKKNLGTKATRSNILETLYDRGYIRGDKSIEATPLGISLINTLEKYSPIIIDEKLTRKFEEEMEGINNSKGNYEKKEEKVLNEAKEKIREIAKDFNKNYARIGGELVQANLDYREQQKKENELITCPVCNKGKLAITYSPKTRRNFIACNAYPACKTTYSLPPNGTIKKTEKICEKCNFPMLMRVQKGKRPWIFCFNPKCPSNEEWVNKRNNKNEE
jgi:DNA topoisomerase I